MDKKGKNIKTSARADAKRHINNNAPVSAERKRAQQARSAEQARAALKAQQEAKQKQAKAQAAQRKRANAAPVQQPKKNTARPAAIKQQPGKAKKAKTKKKYKINYKKFGTFIAGVVAIIVLLIVLLHAIFGGGSKKGWYGVYVSPSKDAKIGVVTELTKKGLPKNVEYAKEVSKGVYEIPIQYGGTSTVIVANKNYSFNRVNTNDTEYYLVSIQAKVSDDSESQKAFEAKHEPEIIKANEKKVSTTSSNKLPDLNVYKDTKGKKTLATISVGSPQPSYDVDELNYISKKRPTPPAKKDEVTSFTFSASGDNLIIRDFISRLQQEQAVTVITSITATKMLLISIRITILTGLTRNLFLITSLNRTATRHSQLREPTVNLSTISLTRVSSVQQTTIAMTRVLQV